METGYSREFPLHHLVKNGTTSIDVYYTQVKQLKNNINDADRNGDTPLHLAAAQNQPDLCNFFITELNALVDMLNGDGNTALLVAAQKGHSRVVDVLISKNAKINHENNNGERPVNLATCPKTICTIMRCTVDKHIEKIIKEERGVSSQWLNDETNVLGAGTFGKVKRYNISEMCQDVAIKIINVRITGRNEECPVFDCKLLKAEVEILKKMNHPNIVQYYGICIESQRDRSNAYIFMQLVDGKSLKLCIQNVISPQEKRQYAEELFEALSYLSNMKIVHMDVKPGNILVEAENNTIKLCDFGLARCIDSEYSYHDTEQAVGTFGYMAPEVRDKKQIDYKADVWSAGIVFKEIIKKESNRMEQDEKEVYKACQKIDPRERKTAWEILQLPYFNRDDVHSKRKARRNQLLLQNDKEELKNMTNIKTDEELLGENQHLWLVKEVLRKKYSTSGIDKRLVSDVYITKLGYHFRLLLYLDGRSAVDKEMTDYMAAYMQFVKGPNDQSLVWPCELAFCIELVKLKDFTSLSEINMDISRGRVAKERESCFNIPQGQMGDAIGMRDFVHRDKATSSDFMQNGCIIIRVTVSEEDDSSSGIKGAMISLKNNDLSTDKINWTVRAREMTGTQSTYFDGPENRHCTKSIPGNALKFEFYANGLGSGKYKYAAIRVSLVDKNDEVQKWRCFVQFRVEIFKKIGENEVVYLNNTCSNVGDKTINTESAPIQCVKLFPLSADTLHNYIHDGRHLLNISLDKLEDVRLQNFTCIPDEEIDIKEHYKEPSVLMKVVGEGDIASVKEIIQLKVNLEAEDNEGNTALCYAAISQNLNIANILISSGAKITHKRHDGTTVADLILQYITVHRIAYEDDLIVFEALEKALPNSIFQEDGRQNQAIHFAAMGGSQNVFRGLMSSTKQKYSSSCIPGDHKQTPLHYAAYADRIDIVKLILQADSKSLDIRDEEGNLPIHHAARGGATRVFRYFCDENLQDINSVNVKGKTPCHFAAEADAVTIVALIVKECNNALYVKDDFENEAIHFAAWGGALNTFVEMEDDFNLNSRGFAKKAAIHFAAERNHVELVQWMLNKDKDCWKLKDGDDNEPLACAIRSGANDVERLLQQKSEQENETIQDANRCQDMTEAITMCNPSNHEKLHTSLLAEQEKSFKISSRYMGDTFREDKENIYKRHLHSLHKMKEDYACEKSVKELYSQSEALLADAKAMYIDGRIKEITRRIQDAKDVKLKSTLKL